MRYALVLGGSELREAAAALGLGENAARAEVLLVDADDDAALAGLGEAPSALARVFVASAERARLLRAGGALAVVERPLAPTTLGPAIFALERATRQPPRLFAFVAASGATGRTSLVANLGSRIGACVAIDATGSGELAWRLGAVAAPWAEIAQVGEELGEGHLRLAAAQRDRLLVVGGPGACPEELLLRSIEVARGIGPVLVDAPPAWAAPRLLARAERVFLCLNPDPPSVAAAAALLVALPEDVRVVLSQGSDADANALAHQLGREPAFMLPRDERACRAAIAARGPAGGLLGRAYDALAEVIRADLAAA